MNDLGALDQHGRAAAGPTGDPESHQMFDVGRDVVRKNLDEFRRLIARGQP